MLSLQNPRKVRYLAAGVLFVLSFTLWNCTSRGRQGRTLPQKTGTRVEQQRILVEIKGKQVESDKRLAFGVHTCDWTDAEYLGSEKVQSFTTADANGELPEEVRSQFVEFQILGEKEVLHRGYSKNPFAPTISSPHNGYVISPCKIQIFVDVPSDIPLEKIAAIQVASPLSGKTENFFLKGPFRDSDYKVKERKHLVSGVDYLAVPLIQSGAPEDSFDFVILGDGFTTSDVSVASAEDLKKSMFGQKALELSEHILSQEPYSQLRSKINVWLVGTPSRESGADEPSKGIVRDTFYDTTFEQFCIDRAAGPKNVLRILEMANETPFDQIVLLVNSKEYTGAAGAIATFSLAEGLKETMMHELGHAIGNLADNYFQFSSHDDSLAANVSDDTQRFKACKVLHLGEGQIQRVEQKNLSEIPNDEAKLVPNLVLSPSSTRWSSIVGEQLQAIDMQYPVGIARRIGKDLTFTYKVARDVQSLTLVAGTSALESAWTSSYEAIALDGVSLGEAASSEHPDGRWGRLGVADVTGKPIYFTFVPSVAFKAGETHRITLSYETEEGAKYAERFSYSAHALALVSNVFDPSKPGFFRGAGPSLTNVWRSSYSSAMMDHQYPFDAVEKDAISRGILRYATP
jgi:hypothetical protein